MASRYPWFKFFASDWLTDPFVRCLTAAQRGVYIDLLAYAWNEGGISRDPVLARRLLGLPACYPEHANGSADDQWVWCDWVPNEHLDEVLSAFTADMGNGRWSHPKLESCRAEKSAESEQASAAGKASAAARKKRNPKGGKKDTPRNARSTPVQRKANQPESEPESESYNVRTLENSASRKDCHACFPDGDDRAGLLIAYFGTAQQKCCKCKRGRVRAKAWADEREATESKGDDMSAQAAEAIRKAQGK